jgi:hypothetical protein
MILAIVIVIAATLSLIAILTVAVSHRGLQASGAPGVAGRIQPIDIEAFRNLTNSADDEFLRASLPPVQFRIVRRARLRATAAYVSQAGRNAALLMPIGQQALASADTATQQAARELINDALLLRRNATFAQVRIYTAMAWPTSKLGTAGIADRYEHLSGSAMLLGRLQNPAVPVRLAARSR